MSNEPRFYVHDSLRATHLDLVPRGDRRRRERYWVMDREDGSDYDRLSTKRVATDTARDLNRGLYGPLADNA
jgi:hypothetical protein